MYSKILLKIIWNIVKSQKFASLYDVAENDSDNWFQTRSINNVDSAHAQRKMAQNGRKHFPIAKISISYRKSQSLNPTALSQL